MYSRNAKGIKQEIWKELMRPVTKSEMLQTIKGIPRDKAAGYDGVDINLIKLLAEDQLLDILVILTNIAFKQGVSLPSWKAVITMIPKRKEDGSWTDRVRDRRPISVLQELGKIASKILAERWGQILLANPKIMNSSQRAFLKDGCTLQCINIVLNIFEDALENKAKGKHLYVVSYDQEKAYDSVQAYTIRASLERFNMPENFISYILESRWSNKLF